MATPYQPAGYGRARTYSPALGRWEQEPGIVLASDNLSSTATWNDLLKSGCSRSFHLIIDGIPHVFTDRDRMTVHGVAVHAPADYSVTPALFIDDSIETSCDCDRQTGLAAGRAVEWVLSWQVLEDLSLLPVLFAEPTVRAALTANVSDATASTFYVDSSTGFTGGTGYYIGHEYIVPSAVTTTSLDGCRRGVCGRPHAHESGTDSGYRYVTDTPWYWHGRRVTVFETLVSPEGRSFGGDLATVGPYCRELWKGYLDAPPRADEAGMVLSSLPLERMLAEEVGAKLVGRVNFDSSGLPSPLVMSSGDQFRVAVGLAGAGYDEIGPTDPAVAGNIGGIGSIAAWCTRATADMQADIGADVIAIVSDPARWSIKVTVKSATYDFFKVWSGAWFTPKGEWQASMHASNDTGWLLVPLDFNNFWNPGWIPIRFESNADGSAADVPTSGIGVLESGDKREVIIWDQIRRMDSIFGLSFDPDVVALRIASRNVGHGAQSTDLMVDWSAGATFRMAAGVETGIWDEAFRTIVTSSGLGVRGEFDTLGFGYGLGLSDEDLDLDSLKAEFVWPGAYIADGKVSVADLLCGWQALHGRCIVQKRMSDGRVKLCVVSTEVSENPYGQALTSADVLMGSSKVPEKVASPNTVIVNAGVGDQDNKFTVNDRARAQAEHGSKSWEIRAPGCTREDATLLALNLQRLSDGQSTFEIEVPCYAEVPIGTGVVLTTAHPLVYDWRNGVRAPSSINAVCVGVGDKLAEHRRVTLLLAGQAPKSQLLCPAFIVRAVLTAANTFRLPNANATWLVAGDLVTLFNPGIEGTESATYTISTLAVGETETAVALTGAMGSWVIPGLTRVTFPAYGSATAAQAAFVFYRSDKFWR